MILRSWGQRSSSLGAKNDQFYIYFGYIEQDVAVILHASWSWRGVQWSKVTASVCFFVYPLCILSSLKGSVLKLVDVVMGVGCLSPAYLSACLSICLSIPNWYGSVLYWVPFLVFLAVSQFLLFQNSCTSNSHCLSLGRPNFARWLLSTQRSWVSTLWSTLSS